MVRSEHEDSWDVINGALSSIFCASLCFARADEMAPNLEPFNEDGTWRTDVFYNTLNTTYVSVALQAARAADPDAKLYINDYNIEQTGSKSTAMLNLVKQLIADGVPIDGVGFQSHFIVGSVPTSFQTVLEQFTALGLEVAITELDIRMTLPATDALLAQQQKDYQSVVQACVSVSGCVGITIWDWTDKVSNSPLRFLYSSMARLTCLQYSWVPNTFSGQGAACPWDAVRLTQNVLRMTNIDICIFSACAEFRHQACIQRHRCSTDGMNMRTTSIL